MITSNSGLFAFNNTTRYNTDDILRIVNDLEVKMSELFTLPVTPSPVTIDITDYRPSDPARVIREYDYNTGNYKSNVTSRWYVKESGYSRTTRHRIGLLAVDLLYASPLEALAADQTVAPAGMVQPLIERLRTLYTTVNGVDWQKARDADEALKASYKGALPIIRIESKRAAFDAEELKTRRLNERATKISRDLLDDINGIYRSVDEVQKRLKKGRAALLAAGFELTEIEVHLSQALGRSGSAYHALLKQSKK